MLFASLESLNSIEKIVSSEMRSLDTKTTTKNCLSSSSGMERIVKLQNELNFEFTTQL